MKKVGWMILGMMLLAGFAQAEGGYINPMAHLTNAPDLFKALKRDASAFKKNYGEKKILVLGTVEKVEEGRFEPLAMLPKTPEIILNGNFHAFLAGNLGGIDPKKIKPGDDFYGICSDFTPGGGEFVKAECQPVMVGRPTGNPSDMPITNDKEALEFSFTPDAILRFTAK